MQIARARACKANEAILRDVIKKICQNIYTELISAAHFVGLERIFDLFLEQSKAFRLYNKYFFFNFINLSALLCGYEGFSDFLKPEWLAKIFDAQRPSGCFPAKIKKKTKREIHKWRDGCADHTSGLGIAVFSLYVNYLIKTEKVFIFIYERK